MLCLNFFQQADSNGLTLEFDQINIPAAVRQVVLLKLILNILYNHCEFHNDYPLAPDKIEIKEKMFSSYQLKIVDLYHIPIGPVGNAKKLVPIFFNIEKYVLHYENLQLYLRLGLKLIKINRVQKIPLTTMTKTICQILHKKKRKKETDDKDRKALNKCDM